ncbi:MAG: AAA family ATPase [Treponemataceae bacterium]|nr:AAA family ATPase [Treponemataceae bacterium]
MKVIIINGPMGVGKTTVGKHIAEKYAGTAFIDGDWCLDIHPFVGNRETKMMAIDNILHLVANYKKCSLFFSNEESINFRIAEKAISQRSEKWQ